MSVDLSQGLPQFPPFHVFYPVFQQVLFPLQDFSIGFSKFYYTLNDLMQLKMVFSKRKLERFSKTWISNKCDKKVN